MSDLDRLHYPEVIVDWPATHKRLELAQELLGDILQVQVALQLVVVAWA